MTSIHLASTHRVFPHALLAFFHPLLTSPLQLQSVFIRDLLDPLLSFPPSLLFIFVPLLLIFPFQLILLAASPPLISPIQL